MNKQDLVSAIAAEAQLSKKDSEAAVKAFINVVTDALIKGDSIQLIGFGTFEVAERAARTGRNPANGQTLTIPAARLPKFKPGKALKDAVKGN